jgi:hypothetical protein
MKSLLGQYVRVIRGHYTGLGGLVVDERYIGEGKTWRVDIKLSDDDHNVAIRRGVSSAMKGKGEVAEMWGRVGYNRDGTVNFNVAQGIVCSAEDVVVIGAPACWGTETI